MIITANTVAIVSGGASGLGAAAATALAEAGAKLVILDMNETAGAAQAEALGGIFVKTDVSDPASVAAAMELVKTTYGAAHIAVNCAGIAPAAKTVSKGAAHDPKPFIATINVNLIGTFNVASQAAALMAAHDPLDADGAIAAMKANEDEATFDQLMAKREADPDVFKADVMTYGAHYLPDAFIPKTGLSNANPPISVPSMTRLRIFAGDFYAPNVLVETLKECGVEIAPGADYLDFGCSSARVLRNLYAAYPESTWWGCDPQKPAIDWAQPLFPDLRLSVSSESPPLLYGDQSFDGAFAFSIWSHFNEEMALAWLDQMHRVIKPGGFLMLTTCGLPTIEVLITRHPARWPQERIENVFSQVINKGFFFEAEYKDLKNFALDKEKYGMSYFLIEWLARNVVGSWSIANYKTARSGHQDAYVLLRR